MSWIIVVFLLSDPGGASINLWEFPTKAECEQIKRLMDSNNIPDYGVKCVQQIWPANPLRTN